jgi:DmsE family decaheme c-type cytochrome
MRRRAGPRAGAAVALLALGLTAGPAPARQFVGIGVCETCHDDLAATWRATAHGRLFLHGPRNAVEARACEACHGPGSDHVSDATGPGASRVDLRLVVAFTHRSPLPASAKSRACLACHDRGGQRGWAASPHEAAGLPCTECHRIMRRASARGLLRMADEIELCGRCHVAPRAQMERTAHMPVREGKLRCTSCHDPHGSPTDRLVAAASVNTKCVECHADKRGPFLHEHPPVVDNCLRCHAAHGSPHRGMLTHKPPFLCLQCHSSPALLHRIERPRDRFVFNRACTNCHSRIHGSNHPAGARFFR